MRSRRRLEICVESVERAVAAEQGGADRIELCRDLAVDGLTPTAEQMRAVRQSVAIPIFAMVRPRPGDFVYASAEFDQMKRDLALAHTCRMDGVVLGLLQKNGGIDAQRARELVELAAPLPVTFHRAFDACTDLENALDDVIATGCKRILTSGGKATALDGGTKLAELVQRASRRTAIVPGGGITSANIAEIARTTGACEFHAALSSVVSPDASPAAFQAEVFRLATALSAC